MDAMYLNLMFINPSGPPPPNPLYTAVVDPPPPPPPPPLQKIPRLYCLTLRPLGLGLGPTEY